MAVEALAVGVGGDAFDAAVRGLVLVGGDEGDGGGFVDDVHARDLVVFVGWVVLDDAPAVNPEVLEADTAGDVDGGRDGGGEGVLDEAADAVELGLVGAAEHLVLPSAPDIGKGGVFWERVRMEVLEAGVLQVDEAEGGPAGTSRGCFSEDVLAAGGRMVPFAGCQ